MQNRKKIKVIEFIGQLNDGGAETLVTNYACLLDKSKFDVVILSIYDKLDSANYNRIKDNCIRVIPIFKNKSIISKIVRKILGRYYTVVKLVKILQYEKPDVIHIHLENLKYFPYLSKSLSGVKLFYTCHSLPEQKLNGKNQDEGNAAKYLIKHNNLRLIALHEEMQCELNRMFGVENTLIVHNSVDFSKFKEISETKKSIREKIDLPEDSFVIGHIGRFSKVKNHTFLLDIFENIVKRKKSAFLILIGDGSLKKSILKKINNRGLENKVKILSSRTDIPQLLKAMDVFVFPSLFEGFSVTLVEAQVVGLRCIISNTINTETILTEKVIALSLEDSPELWANAILDESLRSSKWGNIERYNLIFEIKKLEMIYEGTLD